MVRISEYIIDTKDLVQPAEVLQNRFVKYKNDFYRASVSQWTKFIEIEPGKFKVEGTIAVRQVSKVINAWDQTISKSSWRMDIPVKEAWLLTPGDEGFIQ